MSQHGNEVNNDEDESASVFANNKSVLDFLIKKIPEIDSAMIIDQKGDLQKITISESFEGEIDPIEEEYIAKLINLRYKIAGFDKIRGGLKMTINVFKAGCIIVTSIDEKSIIAITTKLTNLEKICQILSQIK